ncbi:hypothetical protein LEP1GSC202_0223 [Leptospira yanagawae serovar Saopaulo str. Sao Paulo = ATCC 700523]|uniref:Uncharacterized protein n=1 Tax=Leptospira yanagawae serovar Saopaulo str. Sao Paulo = ATCC 700523 TaxID=1249483 RepID=A0A5E8H5Z5_9LEPT|nr:hypothetical protein LEP1GSC202_0223 [Leptospira yanagawae serovar Saopaulo str. Sao Paulo = ATCC 700523]
MVALEFHQYETSQKDPLNPYLWNGLRILFWFGTYCLVLFVLNFIH